MTTLTIRGYPYRVQTTLPPELETRLRALEQGLAQIQERNRRVEKDKAWEASWSRVLAIVVLTYAVMCLLFYSLGNERYWQSAIIPTVGFYFSTLSLQGLRRWWTR